MNKKVIKTILVLGALYGVVFFYQRYKRKKADQAVDTYDEAIKKLQEDNFSTL
jgi:predicted negative regulator of RcsB-dependent stress response